MTAPLFGYMGTKRYLAPHVVRAILNVARPGPIVDLFAGTGSVSTALAQAGRDVVANDVMAFICCLQRAQLLRIGEEVTSTTADHILSHASSGIADRSRRFAARRKLDRDAISAEPARLLDHMSRVSARPVCSDPQDYNLITSYFGSCYFSTDQSIALDSLRQSIDSLFPSSEESTSVNHWSGSTVRDIAMSAWLLTAHSVSNTTGHGAQYMKATSATGYTRICRNWRRDVVSRFMAYFVRLLGRNSLLSRPGNRVAFGDALLFFARCDSDSPFGAAYADPPYTKDQYSRMYHLHETLYLYDYPAVGGIGLARNDRFISSFSLKSRALDSILQLVKACRAAGSPLVLSYPKSGLIPLQEEFLYLAAQDGAEPAVTTMDELEVRHSRMGAAGGFLPHVQVVERVFSIA